MSSGGRHTFDEPLTFTVGDDVANFALEIRARAAEQLPQLSPRGVMANLIVGFANAREPEGTAERAETYSHHAARNEDHVDGCKGWGTEIATARLTLATLLSAPQRAGSRKQHELPLVCPKSGLPMGTVTLFWQLEDRLAEAREAAERAVMKQVEDRAAERHVADERRKAIDRRRGEERIRHWQAQEERERLLEAQRRELARHELEARQRAEADAFDRELREARWHEVLDTCKVVLWLPEGRSSGLSIPLSARRAVGLSDMAARSKSGMVSFVHGKARVTLNGTAARSVRQRVEEKMKDDPEGLHEPILVTVSSASVTQRATTAAATPLPSMPPPTLAHPLAQASVAEGGGDREKSVGVSANVRPHASDEDDTRAEEASEQPPAGASDRHATAPPRPRQRVPHPQSASWLGAVTLPLQPSAPPRIVPNHRPIGGMALEPEPPDAAPADRVLSPRGGRRGDETKWRPAMVSVRPPPRIAPPPAPLPVTEPVHGGTPTPLAN